MQGGVLRQIVGPVEWTLPYVALLAYIFAIITYRLPIGNVAMIVALLGVALQKARFRLPGFLLWYAAFLLWGIIGYAQTLYPAAVWARLIDLSKLWLIGLVVVNAIRTRAQLRFFLIFFLFCFATHPARGAIFNYLIYGYSTFGRALWNQSFGNPNDLAALTLLPLSIAAALLSDHDRWVRIAAKASVIVLPILILMTQSRGVFIALAVFVFLVLLRQKNKVRSFIAVAGVAAVVVTFAPGGVWERVSGLSEGTEADSSSEQRWLIWGIAREIITDYPVTGVGLGAYPLAHELYAAANPEYAFASGRRDTHSTYLNLTAETGYPGLVLFLAMIGTGLVVAERMRRKLEHHGSPRAAQLWYFESSLIAYLVAGVFGTYGHLSFLYIHLGILAIAADVWRQELATTAPMGYSRQTDGPRRHAATRVQRMG